MLSIWSVVKVFVLFLCIYIIIILILHLSVCDVCESGRSREPELKTFTDTASNGASRN